MAIKIPPRFCQVFIFNREISRWVYTIPEPQGYYIQDYLDYLDIRERRQNMHTRNRSVGMLKEW